MCAQTQDELLKHVRNSILNEQKISDLSDREWTKTRRNQFSSQEAATPSSFQWMRASRWANAAIVALRFQLFFLCCFLLSFKIIAERFCNGTNLWIAAPTEAREDWHEGDRWPRDPQSGAVHQTHPDRGGIRHNGLLRQHQGAGLVLHATGRQVSPRWVIDRFLIGKLPFDWLSENHSLQLPRLLWNI